MRLKKVETGRHKPCDLVNGQECHDVRLVDLMCLGSLQVLGSPNKRSYI